MPGFFDKFRKQPKQPEREDLSDFEAFQFGCERFKKTFPDWNPPFDFNALSNEEYLALNKEQKRQFVNSAIAVFSPDPTKPFIYHPLPASAAIDPQQGQTWLEGIIKQLGFHEELTQLAEAAKKIEEKRQPKLSDLSRAEIKATIEQAKALKKAQEALDAAQFNRTDEAPEKDPAEAELKELYERIKSKVIKSDLPKEEVIPHVVDKENISPTIAEYLKNREAKIGEEEKNLDVKDLLASHVLILMHREGLTAGYEKKPPKKSWWDKLRGK